MKDHDVFEAWIESRKNPSPINPLADRIMAKIELEHESEPVHTAPYLPLPRIAVAAMIVGALGLQILRIAAIAFCIFGTSEAAGFY
jgi:hypothetical protein